MREELREMAEEAAMEVATAFLLNNEEPMNGDDVEFFVEVFTSCLRREMGDE